MVMQLREYETISVPAEVKRILEKAKGKHEWGKFLLNLYTEMEMARSRKAFDQLARLLTDEDLEAVLESNKEFRERFMFR